MKKQIELELSPSLKYRFKSFQIKANGMIQADLIEYSKVWTEDWKEEHSFHFAGSVKGPDFWIPAVEADRPEIGHIAGQTDERIANWLKNVWEDLVLPEEEPEPPECEHDIYDTVEEKRGER